MAAQIKLGSVAIDVSLKDIKNIHLSVYPPSGKVRIAAPTNTNIDRLRVFAVTKLPWIKKQQAKIRGQKRETPRDFINRESHFLWGKRYLFKILPTDAGSKVEVSGHRLYLHAHKATAHEKYGAIIEEWHRNQLKTAAAKLVQKWEKILKVRVDEIRVRKMRTKWGSCTPHRRSILLNTDLAKKPKQCLEYIVVHEMLHIIEPTHNPRFLALMDKYLPRWPLLRQQLNSLPVRHEDWNY